MLNYQRVSHVFSAFNKPCGGAGCPNPPQKKKKKTVYFMVDMTRSSTKSNAKPGFLWGIPSGVLTHGIRWKIPHL